MVRIIVIFTILCAVSVTLSKRRTKKNGHVYNNTRKTVQPTVTEHASQTVGTSGNETAPISVNQSYQKPQVPLVTEHASETAETSGSEATPISSDQTDEELEEPLVTIRETSADTTTAISYVPCIGPLKCGTKGFCVGFEGDKVYCYGAETNKCMKNSKDCTVDTDCFKYSPPWSDRFTEGGPLNCKSTPSGWQGDACKCTREHEMVNRFTKLADGDTEDFEQFKKFKNVPLGTGVTTYDNIAEEITLGALLTNVGSKYMPLVHSASRGFFERKYVVDASTKVTVNRLIMRVDITGITTVRYRISPWLAVEPGCKVNIYFHYGHIMLRNDEVADRMEITGGGKISIHRETFDYTVSKLMFEGGQLIDGDIYLKIDTGTEFTVSTYLEINQKSIINLYPGKGFSKMKKALIGLSKTNIGAVTFIPSGTYNFYSTYADITNTGMFSKMEKLTIFCQRGLLQKNNKDNDAKCALIGLVGKSPDNPIDTAFANIDIKILLKKLKLFKGSAYPETMLFQTSRSALQDVSLIPWHNLFKHVIFNEDKEDKQVNEVEGIMADTCFRYRNIKMHNDHDVLVSMCPTESTFKFYLPDLVPLDISTILTMVHGDEWTRDLSVLQNWLQRNQGVLMKIQYIEVDLSGSSGGEPSYTCTVHFKPRIIGNTSVPNSGYKLIPNLDFTRIRQSTIYITLRKENAIGNSERKTFDIGGGGEETLLGHTSSFILEKENENTIKVSFTLNVPSNRLLMQALKDSKPEIGKSEADDDGYKTTFDTLQNITLKSIKLDTNVVADEFTFVSGAEIGDISNANFQLHLYSTTTTASCLYKEQSDSVCDFINTIHGKTFFDQSWMGFDKIGIMLSKTEVTTPVDLCNMALDHWPALESSDVLGVNIENINTNCEITVNTSTKTITVEQAGCKFVKRVFQTQKIVTKLRGWMSKTDLSLGGTTKKNIILGPDVIIDEAGDGIRVALKIEPETVVKGQKQERINFLRFEGNLKFSTHVLPCALIISGDNVRLKVIKAFGATAATPVPRVLLYDGLPKVWCEPHGRIELHADQPLTILEMISSMAMANRFEGEDNPIEFRKRRLSRQFIDPTNPSHSKFYGCKNAIKSVRIKQVLQVLGASDVIGFLDRSVVKEFCVAFNNEATNWEISSSGLIAPPGFSMSGKLEAKFWGSGRKFELPLRATIVEQHIELCVVMPVQKWGRSLPKKENAEDDKEDADEAPKDKVEDIIQGKQVLVDNFKCDFTDGYGVEYMKSQGKADEILSTQNDMKSCVQSCAKEQLNDMSYNGVNWKESTNDCRCVKHMRFVKTTGRTGYKTCLLESMNMNPIEMYNGKGTCQETFGPKFCYRLPRQPGEKLSAYMKGYLKTFAFDMDNAIFKITPSISKRFDRMSFEKEGIMLFNVTKGNVVIKDMRLRTDPLDISLTISVDLGSLPDKEEELKSAFDSICNEELAAVNKVKDQYVKYRDKLDEWINDINTKIQKLKIKGKPAQQRFHVDSINRARAMKAYAKDCAYQCGYLSIPGWTVDDKCNRNNDGESMSCMKYKKDASVASNVGCVANCEAERVKSNVEAMELHARTVESGSRVDKNNNCVQKGEAYRKRVQDVRSLATDSIMTVSDAVAAIERNNRDRRSTYGTGFKFVQSQMLVTDIKDPNCMFFTWRFDGRNSRGTLCMNGLVHTLVSKMYKEDGDADARKANLAQIDGNDSKLAKTLNGKGENRKSRRIIKAKAAFEQCLSETNKRATVGNAVRSLPALMSGAFTIFRKSTVESFDTESPWSVARKRAVIGSLAQMGRNVTKRNVSLPLNDHTCSAAKRTAVDYNDIASYIHKWIQEHQAARRTLTVMKDSVEKSWKKNLVTLLFKERNYTLHEGESMRYWMDRAQDGMKEWAAIEDEQIERYSKESLPIIRKQLQYIYTDDNYKTLRDFFTHRSVDGTNAFKKANIGTAAPNTISDLSKNLQNILERGSSLEEISGPIEELTRHTAELRKRTISCTA